MLQNLSVTQPIMQAPMRQVVCTELVSAISDAGGIGTLDATDISPNQLILGIETVRQYTSKPFAVHLTVPQPYSFNEDQVDIVKQVLRPYFLGHQLDEPHLAEPYTENFAQQMQVVIDLEVPIFQFSCGIPALKWIHLLKENGITVLGTATHLDEALVLEKVGVDAIVLQGLEAYGERSTFVGEVEQGMIARDTLFMQLKDQISCPLIVNGGIQSAQQVQACLDNGAQMVQVGLPFAVCDEADLDETYKEIILQGCETAFSNAVTGRLARVTRNTLIDELLHYKPFMLPYPLQYALMQPLLAAESIFFMESLATRVQSQSVVALLESLRTAVTAEV